MFFFRNFVSSISRVNLHIKNSLSTKPIEDKIICFKPSYIIKLKDINKQNNVNNIKDIENIENIEKFESEYLTLKSIEHALNN